MSEDEELLEEYKVKIFLTVIYPENFEGFESVKMCINCKDNRESCRDCKQDNIFTKFVQKGIILAAIVPPNNKTLDNVCNIIFEEMKKFIKLFGEHYLMIIDQSDTEKAFELELHKRNYVSIFLTIWKSRFMLNELMNTYGQQVKYDFPIDEIKFENGWRCVLLSTHRELLEENDCKKLLQNRLDSLGENK